jgi:hypothetical protein
MHNIHFDKLGQSSGVSKIVDETNVRWWGGGKGRRVRKVDLTAIGEPIV